MIKRRILITGSSGLIGTASIPALEKDGIEITRFLRQPPSEPTGSFLTGPLNPESLSGFDAVINLGGEPVAGRWTPAKKKRILESRIAGTLQLSSALALANPIPRVMISASAIGYYGDRGDETLTEDSRSGDGFLAEVCRQWESATKSASDAGTRTVQMRIGVVLSARGGALKEMLLPFKFGLGAKLGSGKQWLSWVHIADLVGAVHHILDNPINGPVNLVAPNPVTNAEFTQTLGAVLSRPAFLRLPSPVARLIFGEMADGVLLAGQRVKPAKLEASGYLFQYPELRPALEDLLHSGKG
jgi:uncharacterized protein (TIGR01777 family)